MNDVKNLALAKWHHRRMWIMYGNVSYSSKVAWIRHEFWKRFFGISEDVVYGCFKVSGLGDKLKQLNDWSDKNDGITKEDTK